MDDLRLILAVLGLVVVGGIYALNRRAARPKPGASPSDPARAESAEYPTAEDIGEPMSVGEEAPDWAGEGFSAQADSAEAVEDLSGVCANGEPEGMAVVMTVMSLEGGFGGTALAAAAHEAELHFGRAGVFHYLPEVEGVGGEPWFGVANVLEPGTFDLDAMDAFETPGVVLFMRLPGPAEGVRMYERFLDTARHFAERLGGELCDERRRPLAPERLAELREQVLSHDALGARSEARHA